MDKKIECYCGVITKEEPYRVCKEGVEFRGSVAIELGHNFNRQTSSEIAKALNIAWEKGFQEGQVVLAKFVDNAKDDA